MVMSKEVKFMHELKEQMQIMINDIFAFNKMKGEPPTLVFVPHEGISDEQKVEIIEEQEVSK